MSSSTHERHLATLQTEIQTLEAENVAPKEWTLLGESSARLRPHDALLTQDLQFDRTSRTVPIVTDALVAALEDRIKARIKQGQFDDVERRRLPTSAADLPFLPSRWAELQDTKSAQSLAQIYEGAYVAAQEGTSTDDRDGRLRREHEEITRLWEGICAKLDALCNAHYVPKPPNVAITTVSDLPATSLESALPTSRSFASMLAPEEIHTPASSSTLRDRSELTPAEKRSRRAKEKKAKKKMRDALNKAVENKQVRASRSTKGGGAKREKEAALKSLVKSGKGVTVVGKGGKTPKTSRPSKKAK